DCVIHRWYRSLHSLHLNSSSAYIFVGITRPTGSLPGPVAAPGASPRVPDDPWHRLARRQEHGRRRHLPAPLRPRGLGRAVQVPEHEPELVRDPRRGRDRYRPGHAGVRRARRAPRRVEPDPPQAEGGPDVTGRADGPAVPRRGYRRLLPRDGRAARTRPGGLRPPGGRP